MTNDPHATGSGQCPCKDKYTCAHWKKMARCISLEELLDFVDELVYDKNEIVTYKRLSNFYKVHVNIGKQLLYHFIKNCQHQSKELHICYLVAGVQKSDLGNKVHKLLIVPATRLEAIKLQFLILTSIHIYSIQKFQVQDESPLYITHVLEQSATTSSLKKFSSINYGIIQVFKNKVQKNPVLSHSTAKDNENSGNSPQKAKQNGLFSLWQQKEMERSEKKNIEKTKQENLSANEDNKGCAIMEKQVKQKNAPERRTNKRKAKNVDCFFNKQAASEDDSIPKMKKQRRIVSISESESEPEDFQNVTEVEDEPIPPTPLSTEKKQFCRTVTETYTDEDGFMVTKKVKEYSSEPDDDEISTKKVILSAHNLPKSNEHSQPLMKCGRKKQALLMSFFGKK